MRAGWGLALALSCCGSPRPAPTTDAGREADAGTGTDAGARVDGGLDGGPTVHACAPGQLVCGESGGTFVCVDAGSDARNCGLCGNVCSGVAPLCCGGSCADVSSDTASCGSCGDRCPGGQACRGGSCLPVPGLSFHVGRYPTGAQPVALAAGNFRGTVLDVAVANYADGTVSVFPNDGGGGFGTPQRFRVGKGPASLAAGDLDGDGRADLVTGNVLAGTLSVLPGSGDGGFGQPVAIAVQPGPTGVALGDFNDDGLLDVAVSSWGSGNGGTPTGALEILAQAPDGGFSAAAVYDEPGYALSALAVGAFAPDGGLGLAATDYLPGGGLHLFLGLGGVTFGARPILPDPWQGVALAVADLDGDGTVDLAVANLGQANNVAVYLADGGGFALPATYPTTAAPTGIAAGDLQCNGTLALVAAEADGNLGLFAGNGDGTFQPEVALAAGLSLSAVAVADVNGDGKPDIVATDASGDALLVFLNECQ